MLTVHRGGGAQGGLFRLGDLHGLVFIVNIRVCGDFHPIGIEGFKHHNGGSRQSAGVQGVGKLHGSISSFGSELRLGGDFRAIHQEGVSSSFIHKDAGNGVRFTRNQAGVFHHIHNSDFIYGVGSMLAVHGSGGAQGGLLRLGDLHSLVFIVDIRVCGDFHIVLI